MINGGYQMPKRCIAFFLLFVFMPLLSQEKKDTTADPLKDLQIVEQLKAVPEQYKEGFDAISKESAEAFLRFIASDLLEGRDTGDSGYAIASEYAASLFASWGLKPAGDFEMQKRSRGFFGPAPEKPDKPAKRTYFQTVPLKEKIDQKNFLSFIETKGATTETVRPTENIDYTMQSM